MAITTINENDLIKDSRSVINSNFAELDAKLVAITNAEIEELWAYTVTITQSANQTITVTAGGVAHTSTFTAQPGTTWTATIVADEGYNAGTLSATSGTLTDDITISATPATEITPVGGYLGSALLVAGSYTFDAGTEDELTYGGYASNDFTEGRTFTVGTQGTFAPINFPTTLALLSSVSEAYLVFDSADFMEFISSLGEVPQHLYASVFYIDGDALDANDGVKPIVLNNDLTTGASMIQPDLDEGTLAAMLFYNDDPNISAADKTISEGRMYYITLSTAETSKSEFIEFVEQAWGD